MANPGQAISFNANSLQTTNILTADIDHASSPDRNAQVYAMAHANANNIPYDDWPQKVIPVTGSLEHTSIVNLDALIDTFKSYLTPKNANLDIAYNGGTRRYIGTCTKDAIQRPQNLLFAKFTLEFTCQPFGMDTAATTLVTASSRTLGSYTDTPTFGGTAPFQYPIITITFTAVSGSGSASNSIFVGNNANGQGVTVTRIWTNGDVLTIDATQLLNTSGLSAPVQVNGNPVNFSGAIPEWPPGASSIGYSDSFTSRTFNYLITNQNRYL